MIYQLLGGIFVLTWAMTRLIRQYALSHHIVDIPNHRSSHQSIVPRSGGIGFVIVLLLLLPALYYFHKISLAVCLAFSCSGLVAFIGFLDDKYQVSFYIRLMIHVLASILALMALGGAPTLSLGPWIMPSGLVMSALSVFFLTWMLNLYNFMDGIDGIASLEAITACLGGIFLYGFCDLQGQIWLLLCIAMAVTAFLYWNFPPAKIFMGDVGSGFLGFVFGLLAIQAALAKPVLFWSWLILLGVFIVDATFTLLRRLCRGEKVHQAHCSHAYQHAARRFNGHLPVTLGVCVLNVVWLWPLSWLVGCGYLEAWVGLLVAYVPLILLAWQFKAGTA